MLACLFSRIILADRFGFSRWIFYTPLPVLVPAALVALSIARGNARWRAGLAAAVLLLGAVSLRIEQPLLLSGSRARASGPSDFRIMTFNVMAYHGGNSRVTDAILAEEIDILCLVEGTFGGRAPDVVKKALGPKYEWALGNRLSMASRFPIREHGHALYIRDVKMLRAVVEAPGGDIAVYTIDVRTPRSRNDQLAFDEIWATLQRETLPCVVMGDFNIPRGSWHLGRAMAGFDDSLNVSGDGRWLATWPNPLPLWQIDHSFSRGIEPVRAWIPGAIASDHRAVVVDFRLAAP